MIDNYLLEELVAFDRYGTLAGAADHLGLSQPAITRGTKKLEAELNLQLFKREPNKIYLNETGKFAAKKAAQLLAANDNFVQEVHHFDQNQNHVSVASIAPGPLMIIHNTANSTGQKAQVKDLCLPNKNLLSLLREEQYSIIVTTQPLVDSNVKNSYLGREQLIVNVNEFNPLASQKSVSFKDLGGLSFLVIHDIGIWREIIQEQIPDAKFLYQSRNNFDEIRNNSIFPYFTTNLSPVDPRWRGVFKKDDRVPVKISDSAATQAFYANYLKQNETRVLPLINAWQDTWAKVDR